MPRRRWRKTQKSLQRANGTEEFEFHAKQIFDKCIERCRCKTPVSSYERDDAVSRLERVQRSLAVCTSLLQRTHITEAVVDSCVTEVKEAVKKFQRKKRQEQKGKVTWHKYRQELVGAFTGGNVPKYTKS